MVPLGTTCTVPTEYELSLSCNNSLMSFNECFDVTLVICEIMFTKAANSVFLKMRQRTWRILRVGSRLEANHDQRRFLRHLTTLLGVIYRSTNHEYSFVT